VGDSDYDPLFAFGYGLTYGDSTTVARLPEGSDGSDAINTTRFFARGRAVPPWTIRLSSGGREVEVTTTRGVTPDGALKIVSADESAQEDIRTLTWSGEREATFQLASDTLVDFSASEVASMAIRMRVRLDSPPTAPVTTRLNSQGESKSQSLYERLQRMSPGKWQNIYLPLSSFASSDGLKSVSAVMAITTGGRLKISISAVELTPRDSE
jgi:beta-glucosidase